MIGLLLINRESTCIPSGVIGSNHLVSNQKRIQTEAVMQTERARNFLELLKIRQNGQKRTLVSTGVLFLIGILITLAAGLLTQPGRSMTLIAVVDISLGLAYLQSRIKLAVTEGQLEMLEALQE
jgi:hypothetical protein